MVSPLSSYCPGNYHNDLGHDSPATRSVVCTHCQIRKSRVGLIATCIQMYPYTVADLEILKGGFGRLVDTYTAHRRRRCVEPRSGDQSALSAEKFFYVFF